MSDDELTWGLIRRVPMTILVAILIQLGGALVWATQIDARVDNIEQQSISSADLNQKFARLEERLDNMKEDLTTMRRQLDHLTDHLLKP